MFCKICKKHTEINNLHCNGIELPQCITAGADEYHGINNSMTTNETWVIF